MKNYNVLALTVLAAASAVSVNAQLFQNNQYDVILAIRDSSSVQNDVLIDLGSVTQYSSGGSAFQITKTSNVGSTTGSGTSVQADLQSVYGSTLPAGLNVNIFAQTSSSVNNTVGMYLGKTRVGPLSGSQGIETAWKTSTRTTTGSITAVMGGIINNGATYSMASSADPTIKTGTGFVSIPVSGSAAAANSYTTAFVGTHSGKFDGTFSQGVPESGTSASQSTSVDFFALNIKASTAANGSYLGSFTLAANGTLFYTPVGATPVPEHKSYALVGGFALLAFAAARRRFSRNS